MQSARLLVLLLGVLVLAGSLLGAVLAVRDGELPWLQLAVAAVVLLGTAQAWAQLHGR